MCKDAVAGSAGEGGGRELGEAGSWVEASRLRTASGSAGRPWGASSALGAAPCPLEQVCLYPAFCRPCLGKPVGRLAPDCWMSESQLGPCSATLPVVGGVQDTISGLPQMASQNPEDAVIMTVMVIVIIRS